MNSDRSPINRLEKARLDRLAAGRHVIDLSDGNPTSHDLSLDWSDLTRDFSEYLQTRKYSPDARGLERARLAIAEYYNQRSPASGLTPENIFIVSSTSEGYDLLLSLLCKPGDAVLEPQISYPIFELIAQSHSLECLTYPYAPADQEFDHHGPVPLITLNRAQALLFISPHNPTGQILSKIDQNIAASRIPLIVDEVFSEFHLPGAEVPLAGTLYHDNPVFYLNGVSKMCGLPDFKLGWIAMNTCAADMLGKKLEFLNDIYLNASYPMQYLLPAILNRRAHYKALAMERIAENIANFTQTTGRLSNVHTAPYAFGTTLFPRIEISGDQESFLLSLLESGIYVHPGYYYNWEENFRLVISLLLKPDDFTEAMAVLCRKLKTA